MSDPVLIQVEEGVATLTLNRPPELNALNGEMVVLLRRAVEEAAADASVRCVVLTGAGKHFMSGGDLGGFRESLLAGKPVVTGEMFADAHGAIAAIRALPKPVLASVRGAVAGFGLSLMSACDLVIAADSCVVTSAYCNVGLSPDGGGTYFLPRIVGMKRAMELLLLGDRYDAAQMLDMGLLNWVVPEAELDTETRKLARRLATGPGNAMARTKALLDASWDATLREQLDAEADNFTRCTQTGDFAEGLEAFHEKRKPSFGA